MAAGESGLLHATTGSGKTYAVWFGALARAAALGVPLAAAAQARGVAPPPLGVLWLTPMRALAADSARAMQAPLDDLGLAWSIGIRTGDTAPAERAQQDRRFPTALVTTPESLSLMLTRESARDELGHVHTVIVDEWHELMGTKRGVQVQLALARLKRWHPGLVVWGLSATLGNLDEAMHVLLGHDARPSVRGRIEKNLVIDTLLPANPGRFSWGGHLGKQMQLPVVDGDRALGDDARLRQHALAGRGLVPVHPRRAPRLGRRRRAPPRLARQGGARLGRARPQGRAAEGGRRDLVARPRRRLPAGRARAADRLGQGRRAAAAARRPERPRARTREPHHAGADQHARAGRGGRGAARGARRPDREARDPRQAVRRPRPAPGDDRPRRRLHAPRRCTTR